METANDVGGERCALYVVATPLGNLADLTFRALEVLKTVDIIVCEDTRHSLKLLNHYEIRKPLLSCHGYNEERAAERVIGELKRGKNLAYISDAGTPGISDPGTILVRRVRDAGYAVLPIPGVSAFAALASVSGFPGKSIVFEGFLSPKAGRRRSRIGWLLQLEVPFVLYESPFRIVKLLDDLAVLAPHRRILIGREMTKLHEEFLEGTASQLLSVLRERKEQRGEFSIFVTAGDDVFRESC